MILPPDSVDISTYSQADLLRLRERINARLPSSLAALDLEEELYTQLTTAKALSAELDDDTPANQRAQVLNSISTVLKQIVEMQTSLSTTETIKRMERILIETLKEFPELSDAFMRKYEASLS